MTATSCRPRGGRRGGRRAGRRRRRRSCCSSSSRRRRAGRRGCRRCRRPRWWPALPERGRSGILLLVQQHVADEGDDDRSDDRDELLDDARVDAASGRDLLLDLPRVFEPNTLRATLAPSSVLMFETFLKSVPRWRVARCGAGERLRAALVLRVRGHTGDECRHHLSDRGLRRALVDAELLCDVPHRDHVEQAIQLCHGISFILWSTRTCADLKASDSTAPLRIGVRSQP